MRTVLYAASSIKAIQKYKSVLWLECLDKKEIDNKETLCAKQRKNWNKKDIDKMILP